MCVKKTQGVDFDLCPVVEDAWPAGTGPYFTSTLLSPWRLLLTAHCKAADEHLRLLGTCGFCYDMLVINVSTATAYGDPPAGIEVAEDKRALRVPMARDDADNFVIGAGPSLHRVCHNTCVNCTQVLQ